MYRRLEVLLQMPSNHFLLQLAVLDNKQEQDEWVVFVSDDCISHWSS